MLKIQKFIFNPFLENTYLVWDEKSRDAAIIDPGCFNQKENEEIKSFIEKEKLNLLFLINTHCHIDHIFGNGFIKKTYNTTFLAPELDLFMFDLMIEQAALYGVNYSPSPNPDLFISENSEVTLGALKGKFLFTPGHSPGGHCLYFENEKVCFTGDVLFHGSIGRSDLWKGDYYALIENIKSKLLVLPDDVTIYPGHDTKSTIGYERVNNPFLKEII